MAKKLTGVFLLGVMALLITLKHPAFNYCLCLESFTLIDCECVEEQVVEFECDTCCPLEDEQPCKTSDVSDDCFVSLMFDSGEFVQTETFHFSEASELGEMLPVEFLLVDSFELESLAPIRGSPDLPIASAAPLYQRHSVYLL
ncbi:hypothetical protein ACFPK9_08430 [Rubritalea spongiae]|uniref:Uncharacterized protein n=1 Tax=Rubritalea spongiae TaxID=430797 RepID=A0ABW5E1G3_9BACT